LSGLDEVAGSRESLWPSLLLDKFQPSASGGKSRDCDSQANIATVKSKRKTRRIKGLGLVWDVLP